MDQEARDFLLASYLLAPLPLTALSHSSQHFLYTTENTVRQKDWRIRHALWRKLHRDTEGLKRPIEHREDAKGPQKRKSQRRKMAFAFLRLREENQLFGGNPHLAVGESNRGDDQEDLEDILVR